MPDREHTPEQILERELRELGTRIEHPPTPDLASTARERIEAENLQPTRRFWHALPKVSPRWAAAAAIVLVALSIPVFSPAARDPFSVFTVGGGGAGGGVAQSEGGGSPSNTPVTNGDMDEGVAGSSTSFPESAGGGDLPESADGGMPESAGGQAPLPSGDDFDRKVIKTADLDIRSENVRRSATEAQWIATDFDGNVQSSRIEQGNGPVTAKLVLMVPSPEFDAALDELRGLGKKVTNDSVSGKDVTEEFVDLESRERNLLAAEENLLGLYNEAKNVNSSLAIQRELTIVRGEIEQIQGRIKYLEQRTDFSSIDLKIQPVRNEAPPETGWSPADVAEEAWTTSLNVLQSLANAAISVAVFSWWLVPLPIAGFVWWRQRYYRT